MPKSILRIIGSRQAEEIFIRMTMNEGDGLVDHIVLTEHDFTHSGHPQPFVFTETFSDHEVLPEGTHFHYQTVRIGERVIKNPSRSSELHFNETLTRGSFEELFSLDDNDIVIAVDADEVIFRNSLPAIIERARRDPFRRKWAIPMHQFFYRMNYLWGGMVFKSAVAGRARSMRRGATPWRDSRWALKGVHGCHFSWVLQTREQMLNKIKSYSHALDYGHLADGDLLDHAVRTKTYPFDPGRPFEIIEMPRDRAIHFLPASWSLFSEEVERLVSDRW